MPITMADIRAALDPEEPNYDKAAGLGVAALPFLEQLVRGHDLLLAAKATYLAAKIGGPRATPILLDAASHADSSVRVAAAGASSGVSPAEADRVLSTLLSDRDAGVRKVAVRSAATHASRPTGKTLRDRLEERVKVDADPSVRRLARDLLK
jgi:HEAT repeat protein